MTKEEMFKEMEKMAPVLERNGVDIVLGKRIPGSFTRGYFFNGEAGLWEVLPPYPICRTEKQSV